MRKAAPLLLAALLLAAAAAALLLEHTASHTAAAKPATAAATQPATTRTTIRDALGRTVAVEAPVERIALLDTGAYITAIDAVGGPSALNKLSIVVLVGGVNSIYKAYVSKYTWLGEILETVEKADRIDMERLEEAHPSLVIAPVELYSGLRESGVLDRLEKSGTPIVFIELRGDKPRETLESIELLGRLLGAEERARRLAAWMSERFSLVRNRLSDIIDKPRVYVDAGSGDTAWENMAALVHAVAVGRDGGPDVVVAARQRAGPEALQELLAQHWVGETPAARHGRVCVVPASLEGGVLAPIGLEALAKIVHPGVFRDLDPRADLEELTGRFLSVAPRVAPLVCMNLTPRRVVVVDALGRRVALPSPAARVAILYGLEDYVAVGGEQALARLVALNAFRYRKWRPDWWAAWTSHFPWIRRVPDVGQPGYSFDLEQLLRSRPDVVIAAPWMYRAMEESGALEKLQKAGIPVAVVDFVPASSDIGRHLEAVRRSLDVLAAVTGGWERARSLYEFYRRQLFLVVNRTQGLPESERPGVLVFATWSPWRVYGARSPYNVWITLAGGRNLAASRVPGSSGDIDPEYVLEARPGVIVFTCNNNFYTEGGVEQRVVIGYTARGPEEAVEALRRLIDRPGWGSLPAVREGRVYMLYHGLSHGHVFQFAALQWLAKWLHPELFKDLDPLKNLELFYDRYMPYPLRGVWAVGLGGMGG